MRSKFLYWLPRILSIFYILFISLFALDVFSDEANFYKALLAFLIHLIPSFILIATTIIAWKHPLPGGILFLILAVAFTIFFHTYRNIFTLLFISGFLLLIGVLFMVDKYFRREKTLMTEELKMGEKRGWFKEYRKIIITSIVTLVLAIITAHYQIKGQIKLERENITSDLLVELGKNKPDNIDTVTALSLTVLWKEECIPILIGKLIESAGKLPPLKNKNKEENQINEKKECIEEDNFEKEKNFINILKHCFITIDSYKESKKLVLPLRYLRMLVYSNPEESLPALRALIKSNREIKNKIERLKLLKDDFKEKPKLKENYEKFGACIDTDIKKLESTNEEIKDIIESLIENMIILYSPKEDGKNVKNNSPIYLKGIKLSDIDLSTRSLVRKNLNNVNFSRSDLSNTLFNEAMLREADFTDAVLEETDFTDTFLENAKFSGATLKRTKFIGTNPKSEKNLKIAEARSAKFEYATFDAADLTGGYFAGAYFTGTKFCNISKFTDSVFTDAHFTDDVYIPEDSKDFLNHLCTFTYEKGEPPSQCEGLKNLESNKTN